MTIAPVSELTNDDCREASTEGREQTDNWTGNVQHRVPPHELRRLSAVSEWRSAFHIISEWLAIASSIWLCTHYWHPLLYVVTVMWIGARQHALVILMHDGAHYRLFRRKQINECVSELFLGWPMFATTRGYRTTHFSHHRYINTTEDPDWLRKQTEEWEFPKSWGALAMMLLKDISGLNSKQLLGEVSDVAKTNDKSSDSLTAYSLARVLYYVFILGFLVYNGLIIGFLLFWIVPIATWFKVIYRIRSIAEHFGIDERAYALSRTTIPTLVEALFIAPKNVNFHLEHHLYPSVPFYRLPQLHNLLMRIPAFRQQAHVTQTYWGVLTECCEGSRPV